MFVSDYKWTTYFCGGKKQYVLFPFVRDMLLKCVEEKQPFIDYYYMDYSIALAYRVFDEVKRDVDYMEYNNQNAEKMLQIINKKYDIISGRNRILLGNDTIMSSDKEIAHSIAIYI